eukprot:1195633-Prorocentrum_minimum.AAC.6
MQIMQDYHPDPISKLLLTLALTGELPALQAPPPVRAPTHTSAGCAPDSGKFRKVFRKIQTNSDKFRQIRTNSDKFGRFQNNSEKTDPGNNPGGPGISCECPSRGEQRAVASNCRLTHNTP